MKNVENKKFKISNILLLALIAIAIVLITLLVIKYRERSINEEKLKEVVLEISEETTKENQENEGEYTEEIPYIEYEGYQVIGKINIAKINLEYPILIESTEESLKKSISRFGDGKVNEIGNLCLAGHNYINGAMFGDINKLENGDEIEITDLHGNKVTYTVFDKFITDPNDTTVTKSVEEGRREITLITCIHGNKDRLIVRASEK